MWFTVTLALGVFLLWIFTSFALYLVHAICIGVGIPPHFFDLPVQLLERFYVPSGFITLVTFLPNALLVAVYLTYRPKESVAFKHWSGWNYFRNTFFPIKMMNYASHTDYIAIYAVAPHSIFPVSVIFQFILNAAFDHVTVVVTSLLFWMPIVRELACLAGCEPANTVDIVNLLDKGRSVLVTPEGMRAAIHYNEPDGVMRVLRGIPGECGARKGFIRCALGSANHAHIRIIPVYAAGERDLYTVFTFKWLQRKMQATYRYGWPVIAFGWWGSPWPKPLPLTLYFGDPIALVCNDVVRDVDDVHKEYCNSMDNLIKMSLR
jgi:1-acyl-sn-glycerol-3-phosphate acyltransferase